MILSFLGLALTLGSAAVLFSMHGQGGGVLFTPIQVMFGLQAHQATVHSQWYIIVTSLSSAIVYRKAAKIDWGMALALEAAAATGAYFGGSLTHHFSENALLTLLGGLVLSAAWSMNAISDEHGTRQRGAWWAWRRRCGSEEYTIDLATALPISLVIGWLSGLAGVGGGFLKVPMLVLLYGVPIEVAYGTSSFMVSLTTAGGMAGQLKAAAPDWPVALGLSLFVLVGAQIGPRLSLRADTATMRRRFALFLLLIAIVLLASPWWNS